MEKTIKELIDEVDQISAALSMTSQRVVNLARHVIMAMDHCPSPIRINDGIGVWINKAFQAKYNITALNYLLLGEVALWGQEAADAFRKTDAEVIAAGTPMTFTERMPIPGGEPVLAKVEKWPVFDEVGSLIGVACRVAEEWPEPKA